MKPSQANLIRLLQSRNPNVFFLTASAALLFFIPAITGILERPELSAWKRVEMLSIAIGELCFTIGAASITPENFMDEDDDDVV